MDHRLNEIINRIKHGKCEVLGLGRSNYSLIDVLIRNYETANITARDVDEPDKAIMNAYAAVSGLKFKFGASYMENLGEDNSVLFRTPVIRPDNSKIVQAVSRGALLTSEIEFYMMLTPARTFGVTGSDGKTTTTTLIYEMLSKHRKTFIGGNIGRSPLDDADKMQAGDCSVLELSSFQLQDIHICPKVSVLTNISPNHLNWHTGMDEYIKAKANIFSEGCEKFVINADDLTSVATLRQYGTNAAVTAFSISKNYTEIIKIIPEATAALYLNDGVITYREKTGKAVSVLPADIIKLPGRHNIANYMAAIGAIYDLISVDTIDFVARNFGGVEHRLELVRELNGVKYYNSSIDSSPTRTAAALSALPQKPIIICGGSDKNIPFEPLAESLCKGAKAVLLTGHSAPRIMQSLENCPLFSSAALQIILCKDFKDAVDEAHRIAKSGDIVLLSPACASFDEFRNFEERGRTFKTIVNDYTE